MQKMLTLDNLYQFFLERGKNVDFNSHDGDLPVAVQIPSVFEIAEDDMRGMLVCKVKTCHTDLNRNRSFISKENMEKAMPTIKYRPVLAYIHQLEDGTYDFYSHNFEVVKDGDGNEKRVYHEKQVGAFMDIDPVFEEDAENDKTYVVAYAAIPEEYTEAANIIRRKNGTKVSAELVIEEMSYNAKEQYLELKDFYFGGVTLLGADDVGTQIQEGMEGSRLDIADFQCQKLDYEVQDKLLEILNKLDTTLLSFNKLDSEKGGCDSVEENKVEVVEENFAVEENPTVVEESAEVVTDEDNDAHIQYDISHDDIRASLHHLLSTDESWYWIVEVYDDYAIIQDPNEGIMYKQRYVHDDESVLLDGAMERVYAEFLTKTEKEQLDAMREEYVALKQFKSDYDAAQEKANKDAVFGRKCYNDIRESDDFKSLVEHAAEYSVDDIEIKCDLMFAAYAKSIAHADEDDVQERNVVLNFAQEENKPTAYAGLFD